jgi:DNA polymerase-4
MNDKPRKIIHIDMDAFYASVEQRDAPELRGRPVIVGGDPDSRGVVAACSYEARAFGIHSAMPASRARRLCPDALFLRPRFDVYRRESARIREIFSRYALLVEPLSLDEAYLDVSASGAFGGSATRIAEAIRAEIKKRLALTASAGISYNKFLAKLASEINKPDGQAVILPGEGEAFVASLPVKKFHGIGPATAARMRKLGIYTGADLRSRGEHELVQHFGRSGHFYYRIARGVDERPVTPDRPRKSLGSECTFATDLSRRADMLAALKPLADEVAEGLQRRGLRARTVTLKLKYHDFRTITRSRSLPEPVSASDALLALAAALLDRTEAERVPVRLLGITASALDGPEVTEERAQYGLFESGADPRI